MAIVLKRLLPVVLVGVLLDPGVTLPVYGQAPAPGEGAPAPVQPLSAQQIEELVGRIALYPDDLIAIILPASTFPLDVVQADRFVQKLKQDPKLQPDPKWDESIRSLLNYPEVVGMMSQDLDWTQDLGEAVVSQQQDVIAGIQAFRRKASNAGNLKSDDKQVIVQETEVIKIVPADPEVIYVPQYQPATVVVSQPVYAPPAYYPTPYPVYYYPYPPGAAFATGFFFGAATAWACNWGGGHVENNVNISNTSNFNATRVNPQNQQKLDQARQQAQQRQGQRQDVRGERQGAREEGRGGTSASQQPARGGSGGTAWQSQKRPGQVSQGRVSPRDSRPGYGSAGRGGGDAVSNYGRGQTARQDANRGMQSRGQAGGQGGYGAGIRPASMESRGGSGPGGQAGVSNRAGGGAGSMGARGGAYGGGSMGAAGSRGGGSVGGGGGGRGGGRYGGSGGRGGGRR